MTWVSIKKKGKNQKARETEVHGIADEAVPDIVTSISGYFSRAKARLDVDELEKMLGASHKRNVTSKIISDSIKPDDVSQVRLGQQQRKAFVESMEAWKKNIPELKGFTPDLNDPSISKTLEKLERDRNLNLSSQSRQTVRKLSVHAKEIGLTDRQAARLIKQGSNLNQRQAKGLINLQKQMIKDGTSGKIFRQRTKSFIEKSELQRAVSIATTESIGVVNESQINLYKQAAKKGLIELSDYEAVWDATLDDRTSNICRGLNGQVKPFGMDFVLAGFGTWKRPPAHPHCRAVLRIRKRRIKK